MTKLSDVLAEVHRLIEEQVTALKGVLSPEQAPKYAERHKRIEELLEQIANDHLER